MSDVFTRGLRAFLLVLIVTLAMASFSHGQDVSRWYLPILQSADDADMGIALSNPALAEVPVTLTARTYAGVVIEGPGIRNPATVKVPASGQWAQRTHEIFGEGIQGKSGWVELESSSPAVKGLFLVFDRRLTYIDGAELAQSPSSRLIFPKVNLTSPISFVNVGSQAVPVAAVSLVDNNGRLVGRNYMRLAPRSGFSGTVLDLVPSLVSFDGYAVVETTGTPFSSRLENLVGFETYLNRSDVAALNAIPDSAQQRTGYIAHFASRGGYTGRLTLINYSFQQQTVKIRAAGLESGGTALSPASATAERTIVAFGRIEEDIERLFGLTGNALITGYVKWETTGNTAGVLGYVDYGTTDGTLLSAVPAQTTAYSDLFFSQLAEGGGYYTGLAFLNPNSQSTMLSIEAFAADGKSLGKTAVTLTAGERRSRLVRELLPGIGNPVGGYVRVSATLPVYAFQLFGSSASLSFLANVPAQGIQLTPHASGAPVRAATGARVLSEDRTSEIAITPGALSSDLEIIIRTPLVALPPPSTNEVLVASVEALPSGTRFNVPVRIALALSAQLPAGTEIPLLVYNSSTRQYENSGFTAVVDDTERTAVAWVTHFTLYGLPVDALRLLKIDSISPSSGPTGTTLLIQGSGFSTAADANVVTFAGNNETLKAIPTNVTSTSMNVVVPKGAVSGYITLLSGGKSAQGQYFNVVDPRPKPSLSSVSPGSVEAGVTFVELRMPGTGFHPSSVVRMNGTALPTSTYVNPELMLATLGTDRLVPGVHKITVFTPEPGGGESEVREFTVGYPKPTITSISPSSATDGAASVTATITGTGFTPASAVVADSVQRQSTYISATQMRVVLQAGSPANLSIMVSNPSPGGGLSNSVVFVFQRREVSGLTLISQSATSGVVATTVTFTVELRDGAGAPYSGQKVSFSITAGNGSVTAASTTSDNLGRIQATLTLGTTAGQNQVTVAADSARLTVQATGTHGVLAQLAKISGDTQTADNGAALTNPLVVEARDQFGNAVSGASVTFSVTSGGGSVSPTTAQTTGANGRVQVTATLGVPVGTHGFRATSGSVTADFTATATQSAATTLTRTSTNDAGTVNTTQTFTVQATDVRSNPVPGVSVTFAVTSATGSASPSSATTGADGKASTTITLSQTATGNTFTAASSGLTTVTLNVTGNAGAFAQLAKISGDTQTADNGAALANPLVVEARDQFGNVVSGASVTFSVTSGSGSVSPSTAQTSGSNGRVQATATLGVPVGTHVVRATSGSVTADFTAAATQSAATGLAQTSTNSAGTVNTTQTFTVQATDVRSNPVPGVSVTFAVSSGNGSVSPSSGTTGSDGKANATITLSQTAGGNTFTAAASGLTTVTLALSGTAGSVTSLSIADGNNQAGQAGSALSTALKVQAKDTFNNVVSGASVTFSVVSGGGSVSPSTAQTTDSSGFASATATAGGSLGTQTFRATSGGVTADFNATISAGAVSQLAKVSGDTQSGNISAQLTNPLVVEAQDAFGNPVSGVSVTFTVTSGNGSVSPATAQTTGSNGRVQVTATLGSAAATHTFQAGTGSITASFTATATPAEAQVSTLAGTGTSGSTDGAGLTEAKFGNPSGVWGDGAGNLYVAAEGNNKIRKIVISSGVVSTLAGTGSAGSTDGAGLTEAKFSGPFGIWGDGAGNLYVAERFNNKIRKIVISSGVVSTLAGTGTFGSTDGAGLTEAKFGNPSGVWGDGAGNLYVADRDNQKIRKIVISDGIVSTLAGTGSAGSTDGAGLTAATFSLPSGVWGDGAGNLYVADDTNNKIRKIVISSGVVSTLAGTGSAGSTDGAGLTEAKFNRPFGIWGDGGGNLYVTDLGGQKIRKIVISSGVVSTLAGTGTFGSTDGAGLTEAKFSSPIAVFGDGAGNLYVADYSGHKIRKIVLP